MNFSNFSFYFQRSVHSDITLSLSNNKTLGQTYFSRLSIVKKKTLTEHEQKTHWKPFPDRSWTLFIWNFRWDRCVNLNINVLFFLTYLNVKIFQLFSSKSNTSLDNVNIKRFLFASTNQEIKFLLIFHLSKMPYASSSTNPGKKLLHS